MEIFEPKPESETKASRVPAALNDGLASKPTTCVNAQF